MRIDSIYTVYKLYRENNHNKRCRADKKKITNIFHNKMYMYNKH